MDPSLRRKNALLVKGITAMYLLNEDTGQGVCVDCFTDMGLSPGLLYLKVLKFIVIDWLCEVDDR
jgi:hypothetical protein